jgi:DNA-binding beta-propeller fold protein YncE
VIEREPYVKVRFSVRAVIALLALALQVPALGQPALRPVQTIPLPGVSGRIDHLAIDLEGKRLFVAALGNGTLEVVDLRQGKRIRSIRGLDEPQGVTYLPELARLIVATGGGKVVAFDAGSWRVAAQLDGLGDADNVRNTVTGTKQLYVGYGAGALAIIDPKTMRRLGDIKLPGHPESFQLEAAGPSIYVNVPAIKSVAVIDRRKSIVIATILLGSLESNFPMALDEPHHRLFLGTRSPARLVIVDTQSHSVADVPCVGDSDDLFYDPARERIYATGGQGFVAVTDARAGAHYQQIARFPTGPGARTSLWVPELDRLYVAVPRGDRHEAEIAIFEAPKVGAN